MSRDESGGHLASSYGLKAICKSCWFPRDSGFFCVMFDESQVLSESPGMLQVFVQGASGATILASVKAETGVGDTEKNTGRETHILILLLFQT